MFNVDEEAMDISEMRSKILDEIGIEINENVCIPIHSSLSTHLFSYQNYHPKINKRTQKLKMLMMNKMN